MKDEQSIRTTRAVDKIPNDCNIIERPMVVRAYLNRLGWVGDINYLQTT